MSKKIFMLLFLMLVLISMSAVSAADVDGGDNATQTLVASTDDSILAEDDAESLSNLASDVGGGDNATQTLGVSNDNAMCGEDDVGSLSNLATDIADGGYIPLEKDYQYMQNDPAYITITKDTTIDGRGHTIDLGGRAALFVVSEGNTLTLRNTIVTGAANVDINHTHSVISTKGVVNIIGCTFIKNAGNINYILSGSDGGYINSVEYSKFFDNTVCNQIISMNSGSSNVISNNIFLSNTFSGGQNPESYAVVDGGASSGWIFQNNVVIDNGVNIINATAPAQFLGNYWGRNDATPQNCLVDPTMASSWSIAKLTVNYPEDNPLEEAKEIEITLDNTELPIFELAVSVSPFNVELNNYTITLDGYTVKKILVTPVHKGESNFTLGSNLRTPLDSHIFNSSVGTLREKVNITCMMPGEMYDGDNYTVDIYVGNSTVSQALAGIPVTIRLNGDVYTANTDSEGKISFDLSTLLPANYAVQVYVNTDDVFSDIVKSTLDVKARQTAIWRSKDQIISEDVTFNLDYGLNSFVGWISDSRYGDFPKGIEIVVTIGNTTITTQTADFTGRFFVPINGIDVGTYNMTFNTKGYFGTKAKINISPAKTEVVLRCGETQEYGDFATLTTYVYYGENHPITEGSVDFYINGKLNATVDVNEKGEAILQVGKLPLNTYTAQARYTSQSGNHENCNSTEEQFQIIERNVDWYYYNASDSKINIYGMVLVIPFGYSINCYADDHSYLPLPQGTIVKVQFNDTCIIEAEVNATGGFDVDISKVKVGTYDSVVFSSYGYTSQTTKVVIVKASAEITVDSAAIGMKVLENVSSGAALNPPQAGNLTYTSSNESVVTVQNGIIKAVGVGQALVTVSFAGNDGYLAAENKTIYVAVGLNDASVSVNNSTLNLFIDGTFTVVATTVPKGLDVNFVPDDSGVVSVDKNGVVTALKEGTAVIIVKVGGDGVYAENSTAFAVTVSKVPTEISVSPTSLDLFVGDETVIVATLTPADAGNVTFTSSNVDVVEVDNQGNVIAKGKGQAIITVSFAGDNKYVTAENKTIAVTVSLKDASVTVDNDAADLKVGETYAINATKYPDAILLDITYKSSDSSVATVDENGTVTAIGEGTAIITLEVGDDEIYAKNSTAVTVTVSLNDASVTVDNDAADLKVGETYAINATKYPDAILLDITYKSSDSSVATVDENGTVTAIGEGTAIITLEVGDDEIYAKNSTAVTVTVRLKDSSVAVNNNTIDLKVEENFTIVAATAPEGLNVTYVTDESGVVSVDQNGVVTALKVGIAYITVKVGGDGIYAENSTIVLVKVSADKIVIPTEQAFNFTSSENSTSQVISVNLPEEATGFVLLDINGTQTYMPLVNGKANVTVPKLAEGTYNVTVTYTGDDCYTSISTTLEFNVTSNVPGSALSIPDGAQSDVPTTYSISLPGDAVGYLEVDVDGTQYAAPLSNGSASVSIPALSPGNHNVTVKYTGDKNYSPVTREVTLNVTAPVFKLSENKDVSAVYSADATYKVLVTRDGKAVGAGETVAIKFNGKTYSVKTDKDGYAILSLKTNVEAKTYTITAEYNGVNVTNKVIIKHVIKANNKKVKKSKKVTKVKVSLNKVNGKYLKSKVLKIKFNKKTYKVKTNKKGVAKWKVKKSMLKNLKVGKKYKYTVTYGKDIVTKKLTIKK